jgi:prepilin-type N-terminal cleavage/methylation domain-containing protein
MMRTGDPLGTDRGITLVEVLVVIVLLGIIGTLCSAAVVSSHKIVRITDDQTQGLADVRIAAERLGRDIRNARSVVCNPSGTPAALAAADPACSYHLQLWIDYNSDYAQEPDETVTWRLDPSGRPGQFDLVRAVGASSGVEARTVVTQLAFGYDLQPQAASPGPGVRGTELVNVNMIYDAITAYGTSNKSVAFTGRLRNVA